jgi:hypothetical protein
MKLSFKDFFYQVPISEKFMGNAGWVFHRTPFDPNTNRDLWERGIDPTKNTLTTQGQGLYTMYDLQEQMTPELKVYGPFIIKGKADLSNFFIFDEGIFKTARPNENYLDQFKKYRIEYIQPTLVAKNNNPDTSQMATKYFQVLQKQNVSGLVFTSQAHGSVALIYDRHAFIPHSYSNDDGQSWIFIQANISNIKRPLENPTPNKESNPEQIEKRVTSFLKSAKPVPPQLIELLTNSQNFNIYNMVYYLIDDITNNPSILQIIKPVIDTAIRKLPEFKQRKTLDSIKRLFNSKSLAY